VFGIAVSGALRELAGSLADFPAEVVEPAADATDELSRRRLSRTAG
jgi:hypothetical protein